MASLTFGEMTYADCPRSTFASPLLSRIGPAVHHGKKTNKQQTRHFKTTKLKNLSHVRELTASFKYFMGLSRLFKKNKSVESLLTAMMKTVDMRDAEREL